ANNAKEFIQVLDRLAAISKKYPDVLFLPGSVAWSDFDSISGKHIAFNTLPVFANGKLIHLYHKNFEKQDIDTLASIKEIDKNSFVWGVSHPEIKEVVHAFNSNIFLYNNTVFAHEICNDHVNNAAPQDYETRCPGGSGVDIQILIAHGTIPQPQRLIASHKGCLAYVDHSHNTTTQVGQVIKGETQNKINSKHSQKNENMSLLGELRSHIVPEPIHIQPSDLKYDKHDTPIEIGEGAESLLKAVSIQLDKSLEQLKEFLVNYLQDQENRLYPSSESLIPKNWGKDSASNFFTATMQRYAFTSKQEIDELINDLKNKNNIDRFSSILPQLLSDTLTSPIIVEHNLSSIPKTIVSPRWEQLEKVDEKDKKPISIRLTTNNKYAIPLPNV
ncbi:MAG TPA: hypothetical protein PLH86_12875, partial [Saprospiraceae bacterium]|nr:hypothetical protein [Saprospiraceae bacterium]